MTVAALVPLAFLAPSLLGACARPGFFGKGFDSNWQRHEGQEGRAVVARIRNLRPRKAPPIVVGLSGHELIGKSLPNGAIWKSASEPNVLPSISQGTVAFTTRSQLVVLDGSSGSLLFEADSLGRRLEGYSFDGSYAMFLLVDEDDARPDLLRVTDSHGKTLAEAQSMDRIGTPLALGGIGLVPWASQYVSAFDLSTGTYVGRIVARSAPNRVFANELGVFISGGGGVVPLSDALADDPALPPARLDPRKLPGDPEWPIDGSKPRLARPRPISVLTAPNLTGKSAGFVDGRAAVSYFELVAALETDTLNPLWVTHFTHGVVGADVNSSGALYCLEDGSLELLEWKTGNPTELPGLGARLKACAVDASSLEALAKERPSVEEQIRLAVRSVSSAMGTFQEFLVKRLASRKSRAATASLLSIALDPLTPSPLAKVAQQELEGVSEGVDLLLNALVESANALGPDSPVDVKGKADVHRPLPLAALARALGSAKAKAAAQPLARHLASPGLTGEDAAQIMQALLILGGEAETSYVLNFLVANKNVAATEQFTSALEDATRFLVRQSDPTALSATKAIEEEMTHPTVKAALLKVLASEKQTGRPPLAADK